MSKTPELFNEYIETRSGICDNCFRRTYEVVEPPNRLVEKFGGMIPKRKYRSRKDNTSKEYPPSSQKRAQYPPSKRVCKCGVVDYGTKFRPLDKSLILEYGEHILDRMDELDIEYDEDTFFSTIKQMKEDPDNQFCDDEILSQALERST